MKKLSTFVLSIICTAVLSACSSGGGGSNDQAKTESGSSNTTTPNTVNPNTPAPNSNSSSGNGSSANNGSSSATPSPSNPNSQTPTPLTPSASAKLISSEVFTSNGQNKLDTNILSGGVLEAVFENGSVKDYKGAAPKATVPNSLIITDKSGSKVNVALVVGPNHNGFVGENNASYYGIYNYIDGSRAYFVQGNATDVSKIPTAGTAKYTGKTVFMDDSKGYAIDNYTEATVNFVDKTVGLSVKGTKNLEFAGKIENNTFNGENATGTLQGGFFGTEANDIAGFVKVKATNEVGAFGAKKN